MCKAEKEIEGKPAGGGEGNQHICACVPTCKRLSAKSQWEDVLLTLVCIT